MLQKVLADLFMNKCLISSSKFVPSRAVLLRPARTQVLLQRSAEDLIYESQGLAIVPKDIVPAPEWTFCLKLPAHQAL